MPVRIPQVARVMLFHRGAPDGQRRHKRNQSNLPARCLLISCGVPTGAKSPCHRDGPPHAQTPSLPVWVLGIGAMGCAYVFQQIMKDGGDFNLRVFDRAELGGEDKKSRMLGSNH
jgi:hypothetical protein